MHDVRVALDVHQRRHLHGPGHADAAEVVACEIDEHDVLGALLFGRLQLVGHLLLVRRIAAAAARAGDRMRLDDAVLDADQHLRRRADDVHVAEFEIVHVRRRIDRPKRAIHLERMRIGLAREALRHLDLIRVAARNVRLRALDFRHKLLTRVVRDEGALDVGRARRVVRQARERLREARDKLLDLPRRLPVRGVDIAIEPRVADDFDLALQVIEDEQRVAEQEDRLREALRIRFRQRQFLVVAGAFVRHVADGAAVESRQPFDRHRRQSPQLIFDLEQRVARRLVGERVVARAEDTVRLGADEAVSCEPLAAFDGFEQE